MVKKFIKAVASILDTTLVLIQLSTLGALFLSTDVIDPPQWVSIVLISTFAALPVRLLWRVIANAGK